MEKHELLRSFLAESSWLDGQLDAILKTPHDILVGEAAKFRELESAKGRSESETQFRSPSNRRRGSKLNSEWAAEEA